MTTKEESWVLVLVGAVLMGITLLAPIDRLFIVNQGIFMWFGFGLLLTGFLTMLTER
jgi:hypothetical protein